MRLLKSINKRILKLKGVSLGKRAAISALPIIKNAKNIAIGDNFSLRYLQYKSQLGAGISGRLHIGNNVFINEGANIFAEISVTISDYVKLGDCVTIYDTNFHEIEEHHGVIAKSVTIGRNVWIGRNSIVLPGVSIGDNSVVAAGSIVTKSFPPNSLIAGNPATLIRNLKCSDLYIRK